MVYDITDEVMTVSTAATASPDVIDLGHSWEWRCHICSMTGRMMSYTTFHVTSIMPQLKLTTSWFRRMMLHVTYMMSSLHA